MIDDKLHEPKFVTDARNTLGWFVALAIITCGIVFIVGGMFSPFFWPWCVRQAKSMAEEEDAGYYQKNLREYKWMFAILLAIWFIVSWTICIVAHIAH